MSDELTPEEKAAFESLPRERMPAGLETKVVDAMRDHGFLAKRRRVIELSRGRVAGVLAASVALVIVGYSLGLHEGRGIEAIMPTETLTTQEPERQSSELSAPSSNQARETDRDAEAPAAGKVESQELKQDLDLKKEQAPALNQGRAEKPAEPASEAPAPATALSDATSTPARSFEFDLRANRVKDAPAPAEEKARSTAKMSRLDSAAKPQAPASGMESFNVAAPRQTITFTWDGQTFELEADSVRVVEDELGRTLHIYTPEGIIRIRLAE